jgi:hypothetical protein
MREAQLEKHRPAKKKKQLTAMRWMRFLASKGGGLKVKG